MAIRRQSKKRVTLADVAEASGYSVMTVSYALRNHPQIREETRRLIREVADRLGYVRDPEIARLMHRVRTSAAEPNRSVLATLSLWPTEGFFRLDAYTTSLIEGVKARLAELGFALESVEYGANPAGRKHLRRQLKQRSIEGLLILPLPPDPVKEPDIDWDIVAVVSTDLKLERPAFHRVTPHHFRNALTLLERLRDLGYRRPGLVGCKSSIGRDNDAYASAYLRFAQRHFEQALPVLEEAEVGNVLGEWYRKFQPDAVIVTELWLLDLLRAQSGKLPGIDFGACSLSQKGEQLAGIDELPHLVGAAAADLLTAHVLRHNKGVPPFPKNVLIEGRFVPGPSLPNRLT